MLLKRGFLLLFVFSIIVSGVFAETNMEEDVFSDIEDVELEEEAGMTPDSPFYFIEDFFESMFVGDNPELASSPFGDTHTSWVIASSKPYPPF